MEISFLNARSVRLTVFTILVAFMVGGPIYRHVLDGNSMVFRSWMMFSAYGLATIDAKFVHVRDDGTEVVLNRHKLLAEDRHKLLAEARNRKSYFRSPWLISKWNGGEVAAAKELCGVLRAGSIRIDSRIANRSGWVPRLKGKIVSCAEAVVVKTTN